MKIYQVFLVLWCIVATLSSKNSIYQLRLSGKVDPNLNLFPVKSRTYCSMLCSTVQCASFLYKSNTKECGITNTFARDKSNWINSTGSTYWESYVNCPSHFTVLSWVNITKCIKFYNLALNLADSIDTCDIENSHLLKVDSEYVTSMINNYLYSTSQIISGSDIRIGLFRYGTEFKWFDGTTLIYDNWDIGQPNLFSEESVMLLSVNEYRWHDVSDETLMPFICEITL